MALRPPARGARSAGHRNQVPIGHCISRRSSGRSGDSAEECSNCDESRKRYSHGLHDCSSDCGIESEIAHSTVRSCTVTIPVTWGPEPARRSVGSGRGTLTRSYGARHVSVLREALNTDPIVLCRQQLTLTGLLPSGTTTCRARGGPPARHTLADSRHHKAQIRAHSNGAHRRRWTGLYISGVHSKSNSPPDHLAARAVGVGFGGSSARSSLRPLKRLANTRYSRIPSAARITDSTTISAASTGRKASGHA